MRTPLVLLALLAALAIALTTTRCGPGHRTRPGRLAARALLVATLGAAYSLTLLALLGVIQ